MKRRLFFAQALTGTALTAQTPQPSTPLVLTPPVVMAPRVDGATIVWGVSRHALGRVEVQMGETVRVFGGTALGFSSQGERALQVRLEGFEPGTLVRYRAVTEAVEPPVGSEMSDWREFRTLAPAATETHFTVWNDTHRKDATLVQLHAKTPDSDFLLWNGDTCNDWIAADLLVPTLLHPAGTDFTAKRPLAMVIGNHDLRGRFGYRLAECLAMPEGRSYYAFRSGPVAVVCLNTGEDKADAHPSFKGRVACEPLRMEQAEWLRSHVLKTPELRDAPYRVVFCHIPLRWKDESGSGPYDRFSKRSRDHWHQPLLQWGAQIIISGHTHEHLWMDATQDFPYAQLIGGGPEPQSATWIEGHANASRLRLTMRSLEDQVLVDRELKPLI